MFIFNQFGAVWPQECNSTCSGQLPSSASECGGKGLVTVYTACPMNRWGKNCKDICMCATGQCDILIGICRRPGVCQFGWTGRKCNEELSMVDKMQTFPSLVLLIGLIMMIVTIPLLAFYYLVHLPSEEYEKLVKLAELEFDVDEDLSRTEHILKKMGKMHDYGEE